MSDESLQNLLRALAETDAQLEAPPEIGNRLRKQFRARKRRRMWRRSGLWAGSVAALLALIFLPGNRQPATVPPVNSVVVSAPAAIAPKLPALLAGGTTLPVRRKGVATERRQTQEVVTEFFPLMNPAPPFERGQLLRVELPASAMQMVGLPVHEERLSDPVQADVLLGEEGLPRAIRFVQFESK